MAGKGHNFQEIMRLMEIVKMILEIAEVEIKEGQEEQFEQAFTVAVEKCLKNSSGYIKHQLVRGIENKSNYKFLIYWETLESHTIGFRESDNFVMWRNKIGEYFVSPPVVFHYNLL